MPSGHGDEPDPSLKGRKAMLLHGKCVALTEALRIVDGQLDERIPTSYKVADIHEMLVTLDEAEKESALCLGHGVGPFSVFPAGRVSSTISRKSVSRDSSSLSDIPGAIVSYEDTDYSVPVNVDEEMYFNMFRRTLAENCQEDDLEIVAQTSTFDQNSSTMSWLFDFELRTTSFSDKTTRELMYNYITTVADLLQPASHYQNPYKSIYVPNALIGSSDSLVGVGMLEPSHSNVAVFHAILSVSAFHLRGTDTCPERIVFDKLGRLHRGKAFEHLQKALLDELDRSDHHAAMSAMLSLVSSDVSPFFLSNNSN